MSEAPDIIRIAGIAIARGEEQQVSVPIARLPSHTTIDMPVVVCRAPTDGPVLLLLGGLHGDEINGIEIVRRIIDQGLHRPERGTVVCVPIINIFGFINFSREVPDGKDVNRSFPGNANGSLASRVAHHLMKEVIPVVDYGIDFHTGGAMRTNYPQVRAVFKDDASRKLAEAFCAPFTVNAPFRAKSLRQAAARAGKPIIVYEGGESLRWDEAAIAEGIAGAKRVMQHLGMRTSASETARSSQIIRRSSWVRARAAGLFRAAVQSGEVVRKNQMLGIITDPFGEFEVPIKARSAGYVIGLNNQPVVHQGDALVHVGVGE